MLRSESGERRVRLWELYVDTGAWTVLLEVVIWRVLLEVVSRSVPAEVGGRIAERGCCRGGEGVLDAVRVLAAVAVLDGME